MGRRKKAAPNRGPKSSGWGDQRTDISPEEMHNAHFEKYYKNQGILSEDEWEAFMERLKVPLPTVFRVAGFRETAAVLNDLIKEAYIPTLGSEVLGEVVQPPTQLSWYPDGLAWQFNVSKQVLRKNPDFKRFHSFLVFETETGNISRQEAVSMLPPLLLGVQPHHLVMDMCAAPGSKTAQLLEALHSSPTAPSPSQNVTSTSTTAIPPGLLIANDSDYKRTHLLIHQSARLPSPSLLVTNLDASIFPGIRVGADIDVHVTKKKDISGEAGNGDDREETEGSRRPRTKQLLFDRILCDVPCSGDGTLRKNMGIWKKWGVGDGNGLHSLQLRILQRAMRLIKPGGRIVYSTCSLNPVENEAVVAAALRGVPDFTLVPTETLLPSLQRRPGLKSWTPAFLSGPKSKGNDTRELKFFTTYEEYVASLDKKEERKGSESMWPPLVKDGDEKGWAFDRCMRIYPHLQDTGGFFIAVLQKKEEEKSEEVRKRQAADVDIAEPNIKRQKLDTTGTDSVDSVVEPSVPEAPMASPTNAEDGESNERDKGKVITEKRGKAQNGKKGKARQSEENGGTFDENPYTFLSPDDPTVRACIQSLHINPSFPSHNIFVRNPLGEPTRALYLTNDIVRSVIDHNDYDRIRLMTAGTKLFVKQEGAKSTSNSKPVVEEDVDRAGGGGDVAVRFRILSEGLPLVLPYLKPETFMDAHLTTLKLLLEIYHPLCESFEDEFKKAIEARVVGCHILRFAKERTSDGTLTHELVLPIWKSSVSLSLMIDKKAKSALSLRVFGQDITTAGRALAQTKNVKKPASSINIDGTGSPLIVEEDQAEQMEVVDD